MAVVLVIVAVGCGGGGNNLNGRWGRDGLDDIVFEFSGNRFTLQAGHQSSRGTFSISDDQIELVLENGSIELHPFSRTDNTFTLRGMRFERLR